VSSSVRRRLMCMSLLRFILMTVPSPGNILICYAVVH
jgi:hypothetical protein